MSCEARHARPKGRGHPGAWLCQLAHPMAPHRPSLAFAPRIPDGLRRDPTLLRDRFSGWPGWTLTHRGGNISWPANACQAGIPAWNLRQSRELHSRSRGGCIEKQRVHNPEAAVWRMRRLRGMAGKEQQATRTCACGKSPRTKRVGHLHSSSKLAISASSFFFPNLLNETVTLRLSPEPSVCRTMPKPYLVWWTRDPALKPGP